MRPGDQPPAELVRAQPAAPDITRSGAPQRVTVLPPAALAPAALDVPAAASAELAGMLLPTEHVTFASAPHPIVLARPLVGMIVIAVALSVALAWQTHPIVRGHHVAVPLLAGVARTAALVAGGLLLLREGVSFARRLFHLLAFRVVTTNRRVFVVQGFFARRVRPIGNTALAGAAMSQGVLGRMLGFGTVIYSGGALASMRDPVRLYRELEAVANGVDGDTWTPAIRQTIIP